MFENEYAILDAIRSAKQMSHEPGRERHAMRMCEECHRKAPLEHYGFCDAYLCEACAHRLIKLFEEEEAESHADDQ